MLGVLGIGVIQYWAGAKYNRRDWDSPRWNERFSFKNIRFDNNTHLTNNLFHPLAGAAYYGLSRANGLSVGESVLYAQVTSAVWEWALEWREKVSINDMITTTAAGTAAGEFLIQLAAYLNSAPGDTNLGHDIAKTTLGFPIWAHDALDRRVPDPSFRPDRLGLSSAYHHRFTADVQGVWADDAAEREQSIRGLALRAELASLPGFLSPRTFAVAFAEGNFSEASLDLAYDGNGMREAEVHFNAVLAGYYAQLSRPLSGVMVGLGTGLEFLDRDTLSLRDQVALAHFVGPSVFGFWTTPNLTLTLAARGYGDFGVIRSLAWPAQRVEAPGTYKSSLEEGDYQYHLGLSARLFAEIRVRALSMSFEQTYGSYRSIEGLDRMQEGITRDLEGSEVLDERFITLALEPPETWLRFHVGIERLSHRSVLGNTSAGRLERRLVAGAGIVF